MASRYPNLSLVTAPSESATVLLDLYDDEAAAPREILTDGFTLGAPELEGDPDAIDPLYGPRMIEATLEVKGTKAQALTLLSDLARVLVTGYTGGFIPGLWLRVQVEPEVPAVWFRLLRPDLSALSWENVYTREGAPPDRWAIDLDLPAEAFAYGAQETIAEQTVSNDPTAATNPCRIDLGTIKGDAPAPLRFRSQGAPAGARGTPGLALLHASTTTPPTVNRSIGTGDSLSAFNGTAAASADATAIGGSERVVTFAATTMLKRLSGGLPSCRPGRYKALIRCEASTGDAGYLKLTVDGVEGPTVPFAYNFGSSAMIDLGDFTIPVNTPSRVADQGPTYSAGFELAAQRASGTTLTLDHIFLIPLDVGYYGTVESRGVVAPMDTGVGPDSMYNWVDGDTGEAWIAYSGGLLVSGFDSTLIGALPRVIPGMVNTLWMVSHLGGTTEGGGHDKTGALLVAAYYYPRYLNPPGA